ncbi:hypothetical protein SFR_0532 [Streptomyces sp. FR-008]|nr:hypothetical protein SFR_0532 [Streptomyces sp. FR-008]
MDDDLLVIVRMTCYNGAKRSAWHQLPGLLEVFTHADAH